MNILLLNAGSSSLKCTLMESAHGRVVARGLADWAGSETYYQYASSDGPVRSEKVVLRGLELPTKSERGVKDYAACSYATGDR